MNRCEATAVQLMDTFGRKINYLRLSVTDRCNLRCSYCMPEHGVPKLDPREVLSYEELLRLARAAVAIGIEKIRVTGGEPLVRRGIVPFLEKLAAIPGLRQLVLTTNGQLLEAMASDLRRAGVQRLNISLDSLRTEVFAKITRGGDLERVLNGIAAARREEFPVKLNMVVMRGLNDVEIADFASLTLDNPISVRFIEYMPVIRAPDWQSLIVPGREILDRIGAKHDFAPIDSGELAGPARDFRIAGAVGCIGVITPLSGHFCENCSRIRITASGKVHNCLFSGEVHDLRPLLAAGDPGAIQTELRRLVAAKPACHGLTERRAGHARFAMAQVGG